jgi:hypothetical protein
VKGKAIGALVAAASVAGVVLWRRSHRQRERADLYFADGSMVSFKQGSIEAGRLLPVAQEILAAARGSSL